MIKQSDIDKIFYNIKNNIPLRHKTIWGKEDDEYILYEMRCGSTNKSISKCLKRTENSIRSRLYYLRKSGKLKKIKTKVRKWPYERTGAVRKDWK